MKRTSTKVLDSSIAFTKSSFTYKDPYQPKGTPIYKLRNKVSTFFNLRVVENEFADALANRGRRMGTWPRRPWRQWPQGRPGPGR